MKKISKIILVFLATLIMLTTTASAASYSDADGDGIYEPGEEIIFEGDTSYIDENGIIHYYQTWLWDLDNDGKWDEQGKTIIHIFYDEGDYIVTLYQINAEGHIVELKIEVKENDYCGVLVNAIRELEDMMPTGDHKLDKELDKAVKDLNKAIYDFENENPEKAMKDIAKAIKHLMKAQKKGAATQDIIDDLVDLVQGITEAAIQDAIDMVGEYDKHILKANKHHNKAIDKLADGKYDKAVNEFKKAYKDTMKALK